MPGTCPSQAWEFQAISGFFKILIVIWPVTRRFPGHVEDRASDGLLLKGFWGNIQGYLKVKSLTSHKELFGITIFTIFLNFSPHNNIKISSTARTDFVLI